MSWKSSLIDLAVRALEGDAEKTAARSVARPVALAVERQVPKATLNIGLKPSEKIGGAAIKRADAVAAIKATGRKPKNLAVVASSSEPTLVADVHPPLSPSEAHDLSVKLRQDAIAQHLGGGKGDLHGPAAAEWGDFNPDFFHVQSGERLSDVLPTDRVYTRPAEVAMSPRIEKRKGELPGIGNMVVETTPNTKDIPSLSIFDMEGHPVITSMSDLSAAGDAITGVNDVRLREPMQRLGGQDYMFHSPGVWAGDPRSARMHLELAQALKTETGKDPLFMPWAMSPTSIDFAHMPRELMLRYATETLGPRDKGALDRAISGVLPDFRSMDDPASMQTFREAAGASRGALNDLLDKYRERTGMGIGAARLATTDLDQLGLPLTSLRNVGTIEAGAPVIASEHPSYSGGIPGAGLGRLREHVGALDLLPDLAAGLSGPFDFPVGVVPGVKSPLRSLQMAPKGTVVTDKMLRAIADRGTTD